MDWNDGRTRKLSKLVLCPLDKADWRLLLRKGELGLVRELQQGKPELMEEFEMELEEMRRGILDSLKAKELNVALQWCADHRNNLKRIRSDLEFRLRRQNSLKRCVGETSLVPWSVVRSISVNGSRRITLKSGKLGADLLVALPGTRTELVKWPHVKIRKFDKWTDAMANAGVINLKKISRRFTKLTMEASWLKLFDWV